MIKMNSFDTVYNSHNNALEMSDKYTIIVKKNDDTIFELESGNLQISQQREVEPVYSVGCPSPIELNVVKDSEKVVITATKYIKINN